MCHSKSKKSFLTQTKLTLIFGSELMLGIASPAKPFTYYLLLI